MDIDDVARLAVPPPLARSPRYGKSGADITQPSIERILADVRELRFAPTSFLDEHVATIKEEPGLHLLNWEFRSVDPSLARLDHCQSLRSIGNGSIILAYLNLGMAPDLERLDVVDRSICS